MKRVIVEQLGDMQGEAGQRVLVEVPDESTEEEVEELIHEGQDAVDEIEWTDDAGWNVVGFDVEVEETESGRPRYRILRTTIGGGEGN